MVCFRPLSLYQTVLRITQRLTHVMQSLCVGVAFIVVCFSFVPHTDMAQLDETCIRLTLPKQILFHEAHNQNWPTPSCHTVNNNNGDAGGNNNNKGRCCQSIKFRLCCTSASMHDRNMDNLSLIIPGGIFLKVLSS